MTHFHVHSSLTIGEGLGLEGQFFLQLRHPSLEIFRLLGPTQRKSGRDQEFPKTMENTILEEIATQALQHFLVLEALEDLLKQRGKLRSGRHMLSFGSTLPSTFMNNELAWGWGAWGVIPKSWSPTIRRRRRHYDFSHPMPFEDEARVSILVIRIDGNHPFLPVNNRGWFGWVGGMSSWGWRGPKCWSAHPGSGRLRLVSRSASFFFLSWLKPISTWKQQVNTGSNDEANEIQAKTK